MTSLLRQVHPSRPLILLRLRFQSGERISLAETFEAAGLALHERQVIRERLAGRSYGAIAGRKLTRQRIEQVERSARARLGLSTSIAQAVHAAQRADQAAGFAEKAKCTNGAELHGDGSACRKRKPRGRDLIHARLDRLADRWLSADESGRVHLLMEAQRLAEELARVAS